MSLGRPVELAAIVRLEGWRRRWNAYRDNRAVEKTFAAPGGEIPPYVVGLNLDRDPGCEGANGALIGITAAEADRLDRRELRYRRVDVTADVRTADGEAPAFDRVYAYAAKPEHLASEIPEGAIVIAPYVHAVEAAFAELGADQLALYRDTTDPPPVEPVDAVLVADDIPPGNPRRW